jgi:hypothetical protein
MAVRESSGLRRQRRDDVLASVAECDDSDPRDRVDVLTAPIVANSNSVTFD